MLIDWFTVVAQIINFLILVLLLRKFLYGRIMRAMDEREVRVRKKLEDADESRARADRKGEEYRQLLARLDEDREAKMKEAREQAEETRKKLIDEAREEADDSRRRWWEAVEREKDVFLRELRSRVRAEVFDIARRGMRELADEDLQKKALDVFVQKIEELDQAEREAMLKAARQKNMTVTSAFELAGADRKRIEKSLDGRDGISFNYRVDPDLIMGLEIKAPGHKLSWNINEYIQDLESKLIPAEKKQGDENGNSRHRETQTGEQPG